MMYTNIWYVAEFSEKLGDKPVQVRMLDRDFVLFRTESGDPACLSNVCPHRGSSLARGKCEKGTISCPFHGWQFDASGQCIRIPSQVNPSRDIPLRAKVDTYPTVEKNGLIWVFLGDDLDNAIPIIDIPEDDDPAWRSVAFADVWNANLHWSKMTDLDHVHLPIVHGIDFGGKNPFRPPDHKVEWLENGFRTEIRGHEPPVSKLGWEKLREKRTPTVSKLAFFTPGFTLRGKVEIGGAGSNVFNLFYEFSTPIDEETTQMRYLFFRNFMMKPDVDQKHLQRNLRNIYQDKANAESVMPKRAPDVAYWPAVRADREDRLMAAYWQILHELRAKGCQIDRLAVEELDKNGDYRVIPSPGRKTDRHNWVFDAVPMMPPEAASGDVGQATDLKQRTA